MYEPRPYHHHKPTHQQHYHPPHIKRGERPTPDGTDNWQGLLLIVFSAGFMVVLVGSLLNALFGWF